MKQVLLILSFSYIPTAIDANNGLKEIKLYYYFKRRISVPIREAAKSKVIIFSGPDSKRSGGGVRACPLRRKNFFEAREKKIP